MTHTQAVANFLARPEYLPRVEVKIRKLDPELQRILAPGYQPTPEEWAYVEQKEAEHGSRP